MKIVANQKGVSIVEVLLIIVVVGLIIAVGWLIYDRQQSTKDKVSTIQSSNDTPTDITQQTQTSSNQNTIKNESDSWTVLTSSKGAFKIKIPDGWIIDNLSTTDEAHIKNKNNLVYTQGKAAIINSIKPSESYGMVPSYFWITAQDQQCSTESQNNVTTTDFILSNGTKGVKYTGEFEDMLDGTGINIQQCYGFQKGNKFYVVTYKRLKTDTDSTSIVEKSVSSLSF